MTEHTRRCSLEREIREQQLMFSRLYYLIVELELIENYLVLNIIFHIQRLILRCSTIFYLYSCNHHYQWFTQWHYSNHSKTSNNQWCRQDFFGGGAARPLKDYHAPPRRGSGGGRRRMITKLKILKRSKVLGNESIFQKYQHFLLRKIHVS